MGFLHLIPRNYRAFFIMALVCIGDILIAGSSYAAFRYEQKSGSVTTAMYNVTAQDLSVKSASLDAKNQINMLIRPSDINFDKETLKLMIHFIPSGTFVSTKPGAAPDTMILPTLKDSNGTATTVTFNFGDLGNKTFSSGKVMPHAEISMNIFGGDISDFPFENFERTLGMTVSYSFAPDQLVPIGILMDTTNINTYKIIPAVIPPGTAPEERSIVLSFKLSRASTVKVFTIFTMCLMFCLSLTALSMSIDVMLRHRKVDELPMFGMFKFDNSYLTFIVGLIFALPAMRNSLPNAPPIGQSIDVLVFFWCMLIAGLAGTMSLWNFVYSHEDEKMKKRRSEGDESKSDTLNNEIQLPPRQQPTTAPAASVFHTDMTRSSGITYI